MENLLVPDTAVQTLPGTRVLVLAPHPDDEVFGCGAALMRHVQQGAPVRVVVWTDGGWGVPPEERDAYIAERRRESAAAAQVLGYGAPEFHGGADRGLRYGEDLVCEILALIDETRADLVYAPSVLEMHPDHRVLALAAIEAVRRRGASVRIALYEVGVPLRPNTLLDISDLAARKGDAMQCFGSQLAKQRYDLHVAALNRFRSYTLPASVTAAEAYVVATGDELARDPLRLHESEYTSQRALGLQLDSGDFPLVSVIIRSMNRASLAAALDSVALQTYANIEVVVINATGSPHRQLGEWCGRFPLRLMEPGVPLDRSPACNAGLDAARGELLIFLDDDDYFLPHHVARLQQELARNEQAIAAYAGVQCVDTDGNELRRYAEPFDPVKLAISNYIPIHAVLFRRAALHKGARFDESLPVYEDWDFWLQLMEIATFRFVPETGAVYRVHVDAGSGVWAQEERNRRVTTQMHRRRIPGWSDKVLWGVFEHAHYKAMYEELRPLYGKLQQDFVDRTAADAALLERERETHRALVDDLQAAIAGKYAQIAHLASVQEMLNEVIRERDQRLDKLYSSTSWRITKPLRTIVEFLRGRPAPEAAQAAPQPAPQESAPAAMAAAAPVTPASAPVQPESAPAARNPYIYDVDYEPGPAPFVCEFIGKDKRVLEIGCGPGSMTKVLKNRIGSRVTGLELDPQALELARVYCETVHRADLNTPDWPKVLGDAPAFDSVVAADVLEHLYDPWTVLKQMTTLMAPGGNIVVSLPHAGHAALAAALYASDVHYSHSGLLDRTHIRFFGLKNVEELFAQADLKIIEVRHVIRTPDGTEFAQLWQRTPQQVRSALSTSPHADIYQVVVKAVPLDRPEPAVPLL